MTDFVHLNVHSHYSKGWGMGTIDDLCRSARAHGMETLGLTDTNGLYGLVFFVQTAREMGIQPIVGSELTVDGHRALLLVRTAEGYANLSRLISDRHCHQDFDLIRSLREKRKGLVVVSDDFQVLKALKKDGMEGLFVEMSPGYDMATCYAFSRKSMIPPLATNRVYLMRKDQFSLHRILRAVSLNSKLSRLERDEICREHSVLNGPEAMISQFPHAPAAIQNTVKVAEDCRLDWDFNRLIFPCFEGAEDREAFEQLYRATLEGCRKRYGTITPVVRERVDHEMRIIGEKNFAHYFLVVADMTRKARRSCGRGSAAASIVSYALEITHVDPIGHHLFFERFLNPARMDPPDIDVDFAWDERDQIIDYVFSRYGNGRAALVANHNTFGARSAIREVAKVFGLTEGEIQKVTAKIGFGWQLKKIGKELKGHPKMRGMAFKKPWDDILRAACQLEDHFNHLSTHCGGLVVVPDEIRRYCPVEISGKGYQVLQWEKDSVEEGGLVKIDILGNRSLAVIRDALRLVERNYGRRIDYVHLDPLHDPRTAEMFYRGDTFGVFYFESPATRQVLTKIKSIFTFEEYFRQDHFHLNVVVTSIIRPASNGSIRTWLSRLQGQPWETPHPLLRPVLEETLGVMVFQEQLSQAAIHLAGFDPGEAETLRKVVTKKYREKKLRDFCRRFVRGARERGVPPEVIEEVWEMMMGFDGYSFCKPHSASYTLVAYKSAFLRAHYPAEFMAAVIANGGGYYGTLGYLSEARRMGLDVLPPDINKSEIPYTGRDKTIRIGLMQLKGISQEALESVVHNRDRQGPFTSLEDFLQRMGSCLHLKDVRILIRGGCFDTIAPGLSRPALMWKGLRFFRHSDQAISGLKKGPVRCSLPLFDGEDRPLPRPGPYSKEVRRKHEWDTFGFLVSSHPLDRYRDILNRMAYVKACDLRAWVGKEVTTIGWLVTGKTVSTKKGDPMKFVSFEDTTGLYEAVFFPKEYEQFCHMLNRTRPYILRGKIEEDFGAITLTVKGVRFLDRYERRSPGDGLGMISSRGTRTVDPYQNFPEISEEMVK